MDKYELIRYLDMIADMEKNIYLQKQLILNLRSYYHSLGKSRTITKPTAPIKPETPGKAGKAVNTASRVVCRTFKISGITFCILGILGFITRSSTVSCVFLIVLGLFLAWLGQRRDEKIRNNIQRNEQLEADYMEAEQEYNESMSQYNQALIDERQRIENENVEKAFIDLEIRSAESRLAESETKLQQMYSLGIVYPKYRNMVMINSFCEYLKSGRCSTLEGQAGAYNILELEIRLDRIVSRLDQVLNNLEQIKQNQYMLYDAIREGNTTAYLIAESTKQLAKQLDNIQARQTDYTWEIRQLQASSQLTAYNTERIQKELHYMNQMKLSSGEYDGYSPLPN